MNSSLHLFTNFFFNDTATTEIYTLSLHDALPIWSGQRDRSTQKRRDWRHPTVVANHPRRSPITRRPDRPGGDWRLRSEEHTSELQSHLNLVCRLLLEKKKTVTAYDIAHVIAIARI